MQGASATGEVPPEGVTTEGGPASSHAEGGQASSHVEEETAVDHAGQQGRQHDEGEPRGASKRLRNKQKGPDYCKDKDGQGSV